jgi:hypothetical protein
MTETFRRWDTDDRGYGIADGSWIAGTVRRLLVALEATAWVAEEPDIHLLPHLQRVCAEPQTPWTLGGTELAGGVYRVALTWSPRSASLRQLRSDVFALIGSIGEAVTFVHQRVLEDSVCYDVATGMLHGDSAFAAHGHLLEFQIRGAAVQPLCAGG